MLRFLKKIETIALFLNFQEKNHWNDSKVTEVQLFFKSFQNATLS